MPRASKQQQARNHDRILQEAARLVRERGTDGFSVREVMGAAGLTPGGFSKHFASRDHLVAQAGAVAFADQAATLSAVGRDAGDAGRSRYLEYYLSTRHRDHPGAGCPAAALAGDVGRAGTSDPVRRTYTDGVRDMLDTLAAQAHDDAGIARVQLATMVGAVLLARATAGDPISEAFLDDARRYLADGGPVGDR